MIPVLSKSKMKHEKAVTSWQNAYGDSGAAAHIVMNDSVLSMNNKLSSASIGTASGEFLKEKSEGTSEVQFSCGTRLVKLDHVLHVPMIAHNLASLAGLYDNGNPAQFTEK